MTQTAEQAAPQAQSETSTDLVAAVQRVLEGSAEPLTLSKLRAALPAQFRSINPDELTEALRRQVGANVLYQYPKYRSQQDRFWDRPMPVHVASLLRTTLQEQPLTISELRRKLPAYAQAQSEEVLREEVAQGRLYRHPRTGRGGDRYGARPPDPKEYLQAELSEVFVRLEQLGFRREQLRSAALELLHDEEWAPTPPAASSSAGGETSSAQAEDSAPAATPEERNEQLEEARQEF